MVLQNLLYDLSQIAISFDNMNPEYLATPHQLYTWDLFRFIISIGPVTSTIDIGTFLINAVYYGLRPPSDILKQENFQWHWFIQGLMCQVLVIYATWTAKIPFFQGHPSAAMVTSTILASGLGFTIPDIPPFSKALKLVRSRDDFIGISVTSLVLYAIVMQLAKMLYIKIYGRGGCRHPTWKETPRGIYAC